MHPHRRNSSSSSLQLPNSITSSQPGADYNSTIVAKTAQGVNKRLKTTVGASPLKLTREMRDNVNKSVIAEPLIVSDKATTPSGTSLGSRPANMTVSYESVTEAKSISELGISPRKQGAGAVLSQLSELYSSKEALDIDPQSLRGKFSDEDIVKLHVLFKTLAIDAGLLGSEQGSTR